MILRDAIFSGERRHLGAQSAPGVTPPDAAPVAPAAEVRETGGTYESRTVEAQLSSDRVASWLVTQDGATRTALAAVLSDNLAAVRDAAHAEGYERGHREAMQEAREKVSSAVDALEALNSAAETAFESGLAQLNADCSDVVAEVFFKLAGAALTTREAIVGAVTEVLKRVREERELRIHVNPARSAGAQDGGSRHRGQPSGATLHADRRWASGNGRLHRRVRARQPRWPARSAARGTVRHFARRQDRGGGMSRAAALAEQIRGGDWVRRIGRIVRFVGLTVESTGPDARVGEICEIHARGRRGVTLAEVVGFSEQRVLLMPFGDLQGIEIGSEVIATGRSARRRGRR